MQNAPKEAGPVLAQRSGQKVHFDHKDMDYYLSWIMGRQHFSGSREEECLDTAARIVDGDPQSWQTEWRRLAADVEGEALTALKEGRYASARESFLRACTYYRAPLFIMSPKDSFFYENWQKMHFCFLQAAALFDPPLEAVQVPYQGKLLPGYNCRIDDSGRKRPTLIIVGGLETFAEDCYFMSAPAGLQRGFNALMVDLPGQGLNPDAGLFLEGRMDSSVKAVVDYALNRPETDPEHLALFGFSWGGQIALKGAEQDGRIRALISNPATYDPFRAALAQQSGHSRSDPVVKVTFEQIAWRFGLKISLNPGDIYRRFVKAFDFLFFARSDCARIQCPTLCMAGEAEARVVLEQTRTCFERLPDSRKKLAILTREEGGEAHCQVNNLGLLNRVIFDWLDEVFQVG